MQAIEILNHNLSTGRDVTLGVTFDDYSTFDIKRLDMKFSINNLKEKHISELDYQEVIDFFQTKKIIEILKYEKDEDGDEDEIVLFDIDK
jgi:hypothetical protein